MTEVAFHFNTPHKVEYACRILRKAYAAGKRTVVLGDEAWLTQVDQVLWTLSQGDFIPHAHHADTQTVLERSPIHLLRQCPDPGRFDILLNGQVDVPQGWERCARVIEVVSLDEVDRAAARTRWKQYAAAQATLTRHDVATAQ